MTPEGISLFISILAFIAAAASAYFTWGQKRVGAAAVATDWIRGIREWAAEAVDVLTLAAYTCRSHDPAPTAEELEILMGCRHRLSSLIDQGRLLFPNVQRDQYGQHKAKAFQGLRPEVLDSLVAAEQVLSGYMSLHAFPDKKRAVVGLKRHFISSVQQIIDPETMNRIITEMLRDASPIQEKCRGGDGRQQNHAVATPGAEGAMLIASAEYKNRT